MQGDHPGAGRVDHAGRHPGERGGQAGDQVRCVVNRVGGLDRPEQQLGREFLARKLARTAVHRNASRLRRLELRRPAACELRDHQGLLPCLPVLLPPRGLQHTDQLVVGQRVHLGDRLLGQRRQRRTWGQRIRCRILTELRAKSSAATVGAAYGREQFRVNPVAVTKADRDPLC